MAPFLLAAVLASQAPPPSAFVCPFLNRPAPPAAVCLPDATPVENLARLRQAEELLRSAERAQQLGQVAAACRAWDEVRRLCPGSRFAAQAGDRLAVARATTPAGTAEECDTFPVPVCVSGTAGPARGRVEVSIGVKRDGGAGLGIEVRIDVKAEPGAGSCLKNWLRIFGGQTPAEEK